MRLRERLEIFMEFLRNRIPIFPIKCGLRKKNGWSNFEQNENEIKD